MSKTKRQLHVLEKAIQDAKEIEKKYEFLLSGIVVIISLMYVMRLNDFFFFLSAGKWNRLQ